MSDSNNSEDLLLETLPVVRSIVNRKALFSWHSDATDLIQTITLRLLKWRDKYFEKSSELSPAEWKSFAARTAYNEINRHFSNRKRLGEVPLDAVPEAGSLKKIEGSTETEIYSLGSQMWQEICNLSLRQRRALLLHSQELIIGLLRSGISDKELAKTLELSDGEWMNIRARLPMSDFEIACLLLLKDSEGRCLESAAKSAKKARFEARARLRKVIKK